MLRVHIFAPTACQLQLLQLLGLAPELLGWETKPSGFVELFRHLSLAVWVLSYRCCAATYMGDEEQQLQRWQFEHRLWQLLPVLLMSCANDLLSRSAQELLLQHQYQDQPQQLLQQLLLLSDHCLERNDQVCKELRSLGTPPAPPTAAWVREFLSGILHLADQLLLHLPPIPAAETAAAVGLSASALGGGSNSSSVGLTAVAKVACAEQLLQLMTELPRMYWRHQCSGMDDFRSSYSSISVSWMAKRFVKFGTALEAVLRTVTAAFESGNVDIEEVCGDLHKLCFIASWFVQHTGLRGPTVLVQEQRQLYSLLGTMLKVGCAATKAGAQQCGSNQLVWQAAGSCCFLAGQAAVWLLHGCSLVGASAFLPEPLVLMTEVQWQSVAAAVVLQPAVAYLPSLVIFGRCCLHLAEQLSAVHRQAPELLLMRSGALEQQEQQGQPGSEAELHVHSATMVCDPGSPSKADTLPCDMLQSLAAAVSAWVGSIQAPAARAQLEAAGCAPQQLQQRLQALLAAQQESQQGLTDASIAALARQLQKTGNRLSGIAVRQFCNNPACGNLSGPTELRLVSGRGCMCAGCRMARYCGRDCQRAAWKQHKPVCKALAAAGVVAATAATASTTTAVE
jgi:hypothetical protein